MYLITVKAFGIDWVDKSFPKTDEKLNSLSKDEIINIISKARNNTLWNKLFSKNKNIDCITEEDIESLLTCNYVNTFVFYPRTHVRGFLIAYFSWHNLFNANKSRHLLGV